MRRFIKNLAFWTGFNICQFSLDRRYHIIFDHKKTLLFDFYTSIYNFGKAIRDCMEAVNESTRN